MGPPPPPVAPRAGREAEEEAEEEESVISDRLMILDAEFCVYDGHFFFEISVCFLCGNRPVCMIWTL